MTTFNPPDVVDSALDPDTAVPSVSLATRPIIRRLHTEQTLKTGSHLIDAFSFSSQPSAPAQSTTFPTNASPSDATRHTLKASSIVSAASSSRPTGAPQAAPSEPRNIVIFSGGSAANSLVDVFEHLRVTNNGTLSYVIPISDNGGSTSELIRVFGGPGIGDLRSRLVRLIPDVDHHAPTPGGPATPVMVGSGTDNPEMAAIKTLFNHRLPRKYDEARAQWHDIIEGVHGLWRNVSSPKRELVRSLLNHFNLEAIKRIRPSSRFDYGGASIGNLFLTGARLFTGSLEAAIYLLSSVCGVSDRTAVVPALNTNFAHHIAVGLANGDVIAGQNDISHPSVPTAATPMPGTTNMWDNGGVTPQREVSDTNMHTHTQTNARSLHRLHKKINEADDEVEDANMPGTLSSLRRQAIDFSKADEEDLPARIDRLWYINPYGEEIRIPANPRTLSAIRSCAAVIYSIGSLYTSLIPSLVLRGTGDALASTPAIRTKILILNGTHDRESGPSTNQMTAVDFVAAVARACEESSSTSDPSMASNDEAARESRYRRYVTHVVHLDSSGAPTVDRRKLASLGIETVRLYGRPDPKSGGARYDTAALTQALEAIVGRTGRTGDRRRYTFLA